jgi:hypothetical protein
LVFSFFHSSYIIAHPKIMASRIGAYRSGSVLAGGRQAGVTVLEIITGESSTMVAHSFTNTPRDIG